MTNRNPIKHIKIATKSKNTIDAEVRRCFASPQAIKQKSTMSRNHAI